MEGESQLQSIALHSKSTTGTDMQGTTCVSNALSGSATLGCALCIAVCNVISQRCGSRPPRPLMKCVLDRSYFLHPHHRKSYVSRLFGFCCSAAARRKCIAASVAAMARVMRCEIATFAMRV